MTTTFNTEEFKKIMSECKDKLFAARFQIDTSPFSALSHINWTIGCLEGVVENLQKHCISAQQKENLSTTTD